MRTQHTQTYSRETGFTIVELMIATLVFSTILVIITAGVLYFSRTYYASLNRSTTQNTARSIIDSVSQAIQFTGTTVVTTDPPPVGTGSTYFCAGGKLYSFKPGVKYTGDVASVANPGLFVAPQSSGCSPLTPANYSDPLLQARSQQLLGNQMRITNLTLKSIGGQLYTISLTLAYGDDNLLTATTGSGVTCKFQTGAQFCAVSAFTTTVERRLQDGQISD